VHEPKTGGTFVTSVLLQLYDVRWTRWTHLRNTLQSNMVFRRPRGTLIYNSHKHGACEHIPEAHRHKQILASVRNPYDLYVSQYEFGWWKQPQFRKYFRAAIPDLDKRHPDFPNGISFTDYVFLANAAFRTGNPDGFRTGEEPGLQTEQFVKYYFRDPKRTLAHWNEEYLMSPERPYQADLLPVHFLRMDCLNQDLHAFLLSAGFPAEDVAFILNLGKILPGGKGRSSGQKWEGYYTPELKAQVRRRERFLFARFPEWDL
jgi:hypothetical protein